MQYLLKQLEKFSFPQVTFPIPNRGQHLPATKFEVRKHNSVTAGTHGAADLLWSTTIHNRPTEIDLAITGWHPEKAVWDTWCYRTSHGGHSNPVECLSNRLLWLMPAPCLADNFNATLNPCSVCRQLRSTLTPGAIGSWGAIITT